MEGPSPPPPPLIDERLLAILGCPATRQRLRFAAPDLVSSLNARIAGGSLRSRSGQPVTARLDGALVREDGTIAYPIIERIPDLVEGDGIALEP